MRIYGDESKLYQWDTGRRVTHDALSPGQTVHFYNRNLKQALVMTAYQLDGKVVADIPNILLQSALPIHIYLVCADQEAQFTHASYRFLVIPRPKPDDYVYTETEVLNFANLEKRVSALEKGGVPGDKVDLTGYATEQFVEDKIAEAQLSGGNANQGSGLTTAQITALDGMFKVCAYDDSKDISGAYEAFKDAFGLNIWATGITLSKTALSFTDTASQFITATVEPENSTDTVVWTSSAPGVATVVNGVVTPVANGNCTITATAGKVSTSCSVSVAFEVEVVYYTVTNNLTNCVSNNNAASIVEGGSYTATLTADEGYTLEGANISIVVNGEDMTDTAYSDGVITIQNVLGNVVITATAVEVVDESDEVVMLKNISFDGTSYLDTEVIPESANYRYVFGIQTPDKEITGHKNIGGISMRDHTYPAVSSYWEIYWYCKVDGNNYNANVPAFSFVEHCMGLNAGQYVGMDKGDGMSSQPFDYPMYYNMDNGSQTVWLDENCTVKPIKGHFGADQDNKDFLTGQSNYTDDEHPIDSIWLGKVHVTGIMSSLATEANTYAGIKFYCFKVYDSDENPIADMRPAKLGGTVGMWCNVRNKFYPGIGTVNYEEVSA